MGQLRAIHNETAPQLQKILSPAQYQKLQAIRKQEIEEAIAKKREASRAYSQNGEGLEHCQKLFPYWVKPLQVALSFWRERSALSQRSLYREVVRPAGPNGRIQIWQALDRFVEYQYGLLGSGDNYKYWLEARVGYCLLTGS